MGTPTIPMTNDTHDDSTEANSTGGVENSDPPMTQDDRRAVRIGDRLSDVRRRMNRLASDLDDSRTDTDDRGDGRLRQAEANPSAEHDEDAAATAGGPSSRRRTVLKAIGTTTLLGGIGALSSGNAAAAGATFGDGVNLQPSYFCGGDQALGWDLMNQYPDIETVRIEIEPFAFGEVSTTADDAKRWIDEAAANGKHVIATYHHYPDNGSGDPAALQAAADFWAQHYATLSADSSFTINLMNEWGDHGVTASQYASAYDDAIATVRSQTSYTGPIVCDAPGWGQETHRLAEAAGMISDDDLILSTHVYPSAYNQGAGSWLQPSHLDVLDQTNYPCMIGEFGSNMSGQADWSAIVDHANDLGWPVIGWAWNGDGSSDPMNMASPYWGDDCSATSYTTASYFDTVYDKLGSGGGGDGSGGGDGGSGDGSEGGDDSGDGSDGSDGTVYATLDPSTTSPAVGERVTFQVVDETGSDHWLDTLEWSFGDGSTASGWWNAHTYEAAGTYIVTLSATTGDGSTSTTDLTVTVGDAGSGGGDGSGDSGGDGSDTTTHTLQAENGTLSGTTTSTSRSGYEGSGYVTAFHDSGDSVTVSFDAAAAGERTVSIRYASEYDTKHCRLYVNGQEVAEPELPQTTSFTETTAGTFQFEAGTNEITVEQFWGWYDVDAIVVE